MKSLMLSAAKFLASSLLASAVVLTALHQMFWRYEPISYQPITASVHLLEGSFGSCSGVMVAPNKMLTAAHCEVLGAITVNGKPTVTLKVDYVKDLMLLMVDVPCPCAKLPDFELGENLPVQIVGFPLGLAKIRAEGVTAGYMQKGMDRFKDYALYQASVEGGFSGGGIFYFHKGEWYLMGITSAGSKTLTLAPNTLMILNFLINEGITPDV